MAFACAETPPGCCHSDQLQVLRVFEERVPPCRQRPFLSIMEPHFLHCSVPSPHDHAHMSVNYFIVHLEQLCPELSVIMNMVYAHIIQYGSLWAPSGYWTPETWLRDQQTDLLILLSVN